MPNPARSHCRRPLLYAIAVIVGSWLLCADVQAVTPISNNAPTSLPSYSGAPAVRHRIRARRPPRNPSLAKNGRSGVHNDTWMTDTYWANGPLGRSPETLSTAIGRVCITVTFDRDGRLVATCSSVNGAHLFMFDPDTLDTLAELPLPPVDPQMAMQFEPPTPAQEEPPGEPDEDIEAPEDEPNDGAEQEPG